MAQLTMTPFMLKMTCLVDDCNNSHIARGYCPKHYYHARKSGFTEAPPLVHASGRRPIKFCTVEGCSKRRKGQGLCSSHYQMWVYRGRNPEHLTDGSLGQRRFSTPALGLKGQASLRWKGDEAANYRNVHKRVEAAKGPARGYPCVDCGAVASQWSYIGGDPDERREKRMAFSLSADFYQPRCSPCHKAFDRRK